MLHYVLAFKDMRWNIFFTDKNKTTVTYLRKIDFYTEIKLAPAVGTKTDNVY